MRRGNLFFVWICAVCLASGCGWFSGKPKAAASHLAPARAPVPAKFVRSGKIVDGQRLKAGGKIVVVPFKAGAGVEATDQLDKAALMLVKGMADLLDRENAPFEVLTGPNAAEADFIIRGHITKISKPSVVGRWVLPGRQIGLEVEGRMFEAHSDQAVVVFEHGMRASAREKDHKQLGYRVGEDIARFLLSVNN